MDKHRAQRIGEELTKSAIYKDYEQAFHELTHLPVHFVPTGADEAVDTTFEHDNPLCRHLQHDRSVCQTCAMMHQNLREHGRDMPHTAQCFAGLTETAVPVKLGEEVIGFLQTGQVLLAKPDQEQLEAITRRLIEWGVSLKEDEIRDLYMSSNVMSPKQYEAVVKMLDIFSRHLSSIVNQTALDLTDEEMEPERIAKARQYIQGHLSEPINLISVADAVNTSSFYFSRMFKKVTGHTFTEYLSLARVERAKQLMRDTRRNITQIAYDSGFQSLSQFNRVFRKFQHESPGTFRKRMENEHNELKRQGA